MPCGPTPAVEHPVVDRAPGPTLTSPRPLRPAWQVALLAFVITLGAGAVVGALAAVASGGIDRDPRAAGILYVRAFAPFVIIVTIAAYVIQRARRAQG